MVSREKNSGTSEETQTRYRQRERLFCVAAEAESQMFIFTQRQRRKGNIYLFCFFLFFSRVCSTKSLLGKLSARRKHPVCRGPAWQISSIAHHEPGTAREAAVRGHSRGKLWQLWKKITDTAATLIIAPTFQWWPHFATPVTQCGMLEELTAVSGEDGRNYSWKKTSIAKLNINLILHTTLCCSCILTSLVKQDMHCSNWASLLRGMQTLDQRDDKRHHCLQWLWPTAEKESIMLVFIPDPGALEPCALKLCCINSRERDQSRNLSAANSSVQHTFISCLSCPKSLNIILLS